MSDHKAQGIIRNGVTRPESENTWNVKVRPTHRADGRKNKAGLRKREIPTAVVARFHSKYNTGSGCWLWTAGKFANGYGMVNLGRFANGKQHTTQAHRVAFVLAHGEIPQGQVVMHSCDTPACVNPAHLVLGDQSQNIADAKAKGHYVRNGAHRRRKAA